MNHGVEASIKFITEFTRNPLPENIDVVICPPFTSLYTVSVVLAEANQNVFIGAQNCHWEDAGAFTGEISVDFLKEVGCHYVIIGHSERRQIFKEDNESIAKKIVKALENELSPIFCVGETDAERKADKTLAVIHEQLEKGLAKVDKDHLKDVVIAYEPVWAIGTGNTATPDQAQEVHAAIRRWIATKFGSSHAMDMRILYGGSVKPDNTADLMSKEDIDGALVGGASLKAKDFLDIIAAIR